MRDCAVAASRRHPLDDLASDTMTRRDWDKDRVRHQSWAIGREDRQWDWNPQFEGMEQKELDRYIEIAERLQDSSVACRRFLQKLDDGERILSEDARSVMQADADHRAG